jgi:DNA methylase
VGCGDGRDAGFVQRVIGDGARADAAFLDPPYNVRIGGHAVSAGSHREFAMASGELSEAEFRSFLADTLGAAVRCSRDGAVHFVCMDWRHMDSVSAVGSTIYGERLNLCIWNKSNAGMGSLYRSKHELIFVYRVGTAPHLNMVELGKHGRNRTNVWDYASVNSLRGSRREDLTLASDSQADGPGCRCSPGCNPTRRSRAGSLSGLWDDAACGRANRAAEKASSFWIILLLVSGQTDHGPIRVTALPLGWISTERSLNAVAREQPLAMMPNSASRCAAERLCR